MFDLINNSPTRLEKVWVWAVGILKYAFVDQRLNSSWKARFGPKTRTKFMDLGMSFCVKVGPNPNYDRKMDMMALMGLWKLKRENELHYRIGGPSSNGHYSLSKYFWIWTKVTYFLYKNRNCTSKNLFSTVEFTSLSPSLCSLVGSSSSFQVSLYSTGKC